jgi:hypothetical protein
MKEAKSLLKMKLESRYFGAELRDRSQRKTRKREGERENRVKGKKGKG